MRGLAGLHVYPDGGSQAELPPNSWAWGAVPNATSSWPEPQNILGIASTLHGDRPRPSLPAAPVQTPTPRAAVPQPGRAGPKAPSPPLSRTAQGRAPRPAGEGGLPGSQAPDSSRILTLGMAAPTWGSPQPDLSSRQGGPSSNPWLWTLPLENGIRPRQRHFGGFPVSLQKPRGRPALGQEDIPNPERTPALSCPFSLGCPPWPRGPRCSATSWPQTAVTAPPHRRQAPPCRGHGRLGVAERRKRTDRAVATAHVSRNAKAVPPPPGPRGPHLSEPGLPPWPRAGKGHAAPTWQRLKMSEWVTRTLKCLITAVACCRALREQSTERQRPAPTWARSCGHVQPSSGGPEPRAHPGPAFPAPGREPPLCPGWGSGAAQPPSHQPHGKQTLRCGWLRKSRLRCESSVGSSPCGTAALRSG